MVCAVLFCSWSLVFLASFVDLLVLSRRVHPDQMWSSKSSISMRPAQAPQSSGMLPFCLLQGDPGSLSSQVQVMVGRLAEGFCRPASLMMAICLARFNRARVVVPNAPSSFKAVIMCWIVGPVQSGSDLNTQFEVAQGVGDSS
ncbi:TPA: hypothetical protein ACH3X2_001062 [Trebouxia sp. C0005]